MQKRDPLLLKMSLTANVSSMSINSKACRIHPSGQGQYV
jgi:hypothetical protein